LRLARSVASLDGKTTCPFSPASLSVCAHPNSYASMTAYFAAKLWTLSQKLRQAELASARGLRAKK
jgi:hypothetical protein